MVWKRDMRKLIHSLGVPGFIHRSGPAQQWLKTQQISERYKKGPVLLQHTKLNFPVVKLNTDEISAKAYYIPKQMTNII